MAFSRANKPHRAQVASDLKNGRTEQALRKAGLLRGLTEIIIEKPAFRKSMEFYLKEIVGYNRRYEDRFLTAFEGFFLDESMPESDLKSIRDCEKERCFAQLPVNPGTKWSIVSAPTIERDGKKRIAPVRIELLERLKPFFKEPGFLKVRNTWRKTEPEVVKTFRLQTSQWDSNDYYLNISINIVGFSVSEAWDAIGHISGRIDIFRSTEDILRLIGETNRTCNEVRFFIFRTLRRNGTGVGIRWG